MDHSAQRKSLFHKSTKGMTRHHIYNKLTVKLLEHMSKIRVFHIGRHNFSK